MISRAQRRSHVLTIEAAENFSEEQRRWLRAMGYLMPIAGGDGEEGAGEESSESEGSGEGSGTGGEEEGEESSESESSEEENEEEEEDGHVSLSHNEYERLKRIARDHDRAEKKRRTEEQKQKERLKKEQGQFEELLKEKDDAIAQVESERDEARYQLDAYKRRVRVSEAAKRLNFKDPEDAFRFLSDEDTEDEATTERALKRLTKTKPYLVAERRSTGAPVGGDGVTLTKADIDRMSEAEINARWPEVQKALAGGGIS